MLPLFRLSLATWKCVCGEDFFFHQPLFTFQTTFFSRPLRFSISFLLRSSIFDLLLLRLWQMALHILFTSLCAICWYWFRGIYVPRSTNIKTYHTTNLNDHHYNSKCIPVAEFFVRFAPFSEQCNKLNIDGKRKQKRRLLLFAGYLLTNYHVRLSKGCVMCVKIKKMSSYLWISWIDLKLNKFNLFRSLMFNLTFEIGVIWNGPNETCLFTNLYCCYDQIKKQLNYFIRIFHQFFVILLIATKF